VIARVVLVLCLAVALVGCGDTKGDEKAPVRVYFLHDGKVWPVARTIGAGFDLGDEALRVLQDGPTQAERDVGLTTEVPENAGGPATDAARAQVVYTGTQFSRRAMDIDGKRYTRADFEEQTPAILVESPLAFQGAQTPLRVTGTTARGTTAALPTGRWLLVVSVADSTSGLTRTARRYVRIG